QCGVGEVEARCVGAEVDHPRCIVRGQCHRSGASGDVLGKGHFVGDQGYRRAAGGDAVGAADAAHRQRGGCSVAEGHRACGIGGEVGDIVVLVQVEVVGKAAVAEQSHAA